MEGIAEKKVREYLDRIEKGDKAINSFLFINREALREAKELDKKKNKGKLYGKVIAVKSNINVKGMPISCGSKTLEDYKGTYDASVIERIKREDGIIIGILNCDEFACGSSGENSGFGATQNPRVLGRIPGGSSSGSAAAVAAGFCDVSLGSDTGGSIRNPASHCGVVGVKPSYGLVSRYGLIDLSMSLDQIGPVARNVEDASLVLSVIAGKDEKDTITFESKEIQLKNPGKIKIGVLRLEGVDKRIQDVIDSNIEKIKKRLKWDIKEIEIEQIDLAVQTYYLLVYVEFFSATRRFDGRKYGKKIEDSCGPEVLRRILGGSEISKAEFYGRYYQKALDVKEFIKQEFQKAFSKVDCIMMPVVPILPWKIGESKTMKPEEVYAADALTIPANLAGICGISIPGGIVREGNDEIPVGLQILCANGEDSKMLSIAKEVEGLNN